MNLGHGRAGHLPDYSFAVYRYIPSWDDYNDLIKDNPKDYMYAFRQMIYAMKYLRGAIEEFETDKYDEIESAPYIDRINGIIRKRQLSASKDWKKFGEELSGRTIEDFDLLKYQEEYLNASDKVNTFIGKFVEAAMNQKGMVINRIFRSGNILAGFSKEL